MEIQFNLLLWRAQFRKMQQRRFFLIMASSAVLAFFIIIVSHFIIVHEINYQERQTDLLNQSILMLATKIKYAEDLQKQKQHLDARMVEMRQFNNLIIQYEKLNTP